MAKQYLLPRDGAFYKANLHGHTTMSDGRLTPEQFAREYKEAGYSVVCITDHRSYHWHQQLCASDFVCLAGYEADINSPEDGPNRLSRTRGCYHFNFYDTAPQMRPEGFVPPVVSTEQYHDTDAINRWIADMSDAGFLACYNHPYWSLQDFRNYTPLKGLFAMEIYNHGCEHDGLYGYAPQAYDEMLRAGQRLCCLATDDNHNAVPPDDPFSDSFGGFTMLKMPVLDYANAIAAMRRGDLYASTGPMINELYVEDGVLCVSTSAVEKIYVITDGRDTLRAVAPSGKDGLTSARLTLTGAEQWIRVDCRDSHGRHAYTRAYFREELQQG